MRYLGLDLGTKTLGIAISDKLGIISSPYKTFRFNDYEELLNPIASLIEEYEIDEIALGLPKNMDNSLGFASHRSIEFKNFLENHIDKPIILVDERLSTLEAEKYLISADESRRKRHEHIDAVAASVILNTYMNMKGKKNDEK